LRLFNQF